MRVLHVISTLNIGSGIANFVMSYYRRIVCDGMQFDFLLFKHMDKEFVEEVEALGGRVYFIPKPTLKFGKYKKAVKKFFKEHKGEWDIVHIHEILVQRFICKPAKKYGGVKAIATHSHVSKFILPVYGVSAAKNRLIAFVKKLRNGVLLRGIRKNSDFCFACSEAAGQALYGKKILSAENFCVIKNAIEPEKYAFNEQIRDKYREEFNLTGKKVIIQVGRLCEPKNQTFFLEVMQKLCEADNLYALMLVGDGELKEQVAEKIGELNLGDNVIMTGNRTDVEKLFQCADLSVLPSLTEGLGIVLIEAQASGLPCIASTGVPEEAQITPFVQFLDLNTEEWVNAVLNAELVRRDAKEYIAASGYDVTLNAEKLRGIYSSMTEGK